MRGLLVILLSLLLSCSTTSRSEAAYGDYKAESEAEALKVFTIRPEDRLLVVFPVGDYREQRALELSSREFLSGQGINAIALSDIYPFALSEETDWQEVSWAVSDAEPSITCEIALLGSETLPSGAISCRSYRVTLRQSRSGEELAIFSMALSGGEEAGSYEESLVPAARCFAKALGKALSAFR